MAVIDLTRNNVLGPSCACESVCISPHLCRQRAGRRRQGATTRNTAGLMIDQIS